MNFAKVIQQIEEILLNIGTVIKTIIVKLGIGAIGRAFQAASRLDFRIRKEISILPQNYCFVIIVEPDYKTVIMEKVGDELRYRRVASTDNIDLTFTIKTLETAFMIVTGRMGLAGAYAEHRVTVHGSPFEMMTLLRCLEMVIAYLLPRFICRRIMRRVPRMGFHRQIFRFIIYLLGLPGIL